MKENYSWDAVTTKAKKKIANIVTEPFKKFGADLRNSINETVDDFVDDITGRYKVEVTKGLSNLARGAMSDIGTSSARFGEMLTTNKGALQKGLTGGQDFSTGYAGAAVNWATGRTTSGENLEFLTNLTGRRVRERDVHYLPHLRTRLDPRHRQQRTDQPREIPVPDGLQGRARRSQCSG